MNWDKFQGSWKEMRGKAQQRWGRLTNDDLDVIEGKREELEGKLQEAYGYSREKAREEFEEFCRSCN
jgi:uncharacterized protein YjbJ (UPF0337 family)